MEIYNPITSSLLQRIVYPATFREKFQAVLGKKLVTEIQPWFSNLSFLSLFRNHCGIWKFANRNFAVYS